MTERDLRHEKWREYHFGATTYKIDNPQTLFFREGGTTHRVLTLDGVVHCVPAPGCCGCVLRWMPVDPSKPVEF